MLLGTTLMRKEYVEGIEKGGVNLLTCQAHHFVQLESIEHCVPISAYSPLGPTHGYFLFLYIFPLAKILRAQFNLYTWSSNCFLSICGYISSFIFRIKSVDSLVCSNYVVAEGLCGSTENHRKYKYTYIVLNRHCILYIII